MRRIGTYLPLLLLLIAVLAAAGCSTLEGMPQGASITDMPPASLPRPAVGDRSYFSNGRRLEVTAVSGDSVDWKRSARHRYRAERNFLLPPSREESAKRITTSTLEAPVTSVWPLALGRDLDFFLRRTSTDKGSGERKESTRYWSCDVDAAQRITVLAGSFDTYRIDCTRKTTSYKFRQRRIWYYAPEIERPVLRLDYYRKERKRRLELTAFRPALSGLSKASLKDYRKRFQQVMEGAASGQPMAWRSERERASIVIEPLKTLQWPDGTFCRNYRQRVTIDGNTRTGAGMVCRTAEGRWRVPRKVDRAGSIGF